MPQFVLLFHDCPPGYERPSHWDLMLESESALQTWALPRLPNAWQALQSKTAESFSGCPRLDKTNAVFAEQLPPHRVDYLTLEGPLSGDRGTVRRMEEGHYTVIEQQDGILAADIHGHVWSGRIMLQRDVTDATWNLTVENESLID